MLPDPAPNAALRRRRCRRFATHFYLAGYALLRAGIRPAARARSPPRATPGPTVSIDPSSAAPLAAATGSSTGWRAPHLLLPNRDEAAVLTGIADPAAAARALAAHAEEVVVTLGAEGALWSDGAAVVHVPAFPVVRADSTGAGDAFAAGLLSARADGAAPADALRSGCALAARAVARVGARG